jgi:PAS domain S-box-containing protein
MMRFSSEMIVMIDEKGMVLKANDPFSTFSGIPHEALVGQNITSIPDELIQDLPVSSYLGESEEQQVRTLFRNIWRNGSDCYFRIKVVPTIFDSGSRGFTIIIEDISDQKRAENALAERQQLYQDVIKNIQDVFYRTDPDGNLIMASSNWAHLLGYDSVDECLGCNIARDFYMDPEKRRLLLDAIDRDGLVKDFEVV